MLWYSFAVRIASLSPAVTEILYLLGVGDQIVCTDQFSDFPEDVVSIPHLNGYQSISMEEILSHDPDLIFTSTVIQEALAEELQRIHTSVVHTDPRTIHAIYDSIRSIGMLFERDAEAEQVVLAMQQECNNVKRRAALLPRRLRVYIEEWPATSVGETCTEPFVSGNWVPEIAWIAGVEQFPVNAGDLSKPVSLADVSTWDPDCIILSWCGAGDRVDKDVLLKRSGWEELRAVHAGYVRIIDDSLLNRPGPRLVEGAQRLYGWAFEMLH